MLRLLGRAGQISASPTTWSCRSTRSKVRDHMLGRLGDADRTETVARARSFA
jgi:hypothetical protein